MVQQGMRNLGIVCIVLGIIALFSAYIFKLRSEFGISLISMGIADFGYWYVVNKNPNKIKHLESEDDERNRFIFNKANSDAFKITLLCMIFLYLATNLLMDLSEFISEKNLISYIVYFMGAMELLLVFIYKRRY